MKKIAIILIAFLIINIIFLSWCNSNKKEESEYSIIGTWIQNDRPENIMIFKENDELSITEGTNGTITGTYTIVNSTILNVNFDFGEIKSPTVSFEYKFESEDILILNFTQEGTNENINQTYYKKNSI